jgi:aquaporin Z
VNPARSTAVALFADGWALRQLWLFWLAPMMGAAVGALMWKALLSSTDK